MISILYLMFIFCCLQLNVILSALLSHAAPVSVIARSLCVLFNNVVDRAAFYTIVSSCQDQLRRELVHRLGLLNVWSPLFPGTQALSFINF